MCVAAAPRSRKSLLLLSAALLALPACIERPESPAAKRATFDRARVADVLQQQVPASARQLNARFGDVIELAAWEVTPDPVERGGRATVTFYWRALQDVDDDWKVFVHVDDALRQAPRINADHWPAAGRYRTAMWRRGEIIRDTFTFRTPSAGADRLEIWTGFYQGNDRLPLASAGTGINDGVNRVRAGLVALK